MIFKFILIALLTLAAASTVAADSPLVPLYRLDKEDADHNLLTAQPQERDTLVAQGWEFVGIVGYIYADATVSGTVPLYRLYRAPTAALQSGDRFYTTRASERDDYIARGYTLEGITGYVLPPGTPGWFRPLYCVFDPEDKTHWYMGGRSEYNRLSADLQPEGAIAFCYALPSTEQPILSSAQVIQIASAYCQSVHQPVTAAATAAFPVPREDEEDSALPYWQPCWQVKFDGQATLEVVDATGVVNDYSNDAYRPTSWRPSGPLIAVSDAIQRATVALQATAQTEDRAPVDTQLVQNNPGAPMAGDSSWLMGWRRRLGSLDYHDDGGVFFIDAETGELITMRLSYFTPPPMDVSVSVTQDQAQAAAQSALVSANIPDATLHAGRTQIVRPDTFWQSRPSTVLDGPSRVAWVFYFEEPNNRSGQIFIDAQTLAVIGGYEGGMRGGNRGIRGPKSGPKRRLLKKARVLSPKGDLKKKQKRGQPLGKKAQPVKHARKAESAGRPHHGR